MPPPLPYFKVNICPFSLPHFALIFFPYLWSFRWPNYIVTLPRYFYFRLPHLNIPTGPPSDELDMNIQRTSTFQSLKRIQPLPVQKTLIVNCAPIDPKKKFTFVALWIFNMHSEFSRPAMCNNAIMIISSQM
jgi:hypothetical protein